MADRYDYDVMIVGAGDVGCAIARELSAFELRIALVEASGDIGCATSKANTAILHTGYDAKPGTIEARLVARGHDLLLQYAEEIGIPLERTGALLVAWNQDQLARFPAICATAASNGYDRIVELSRDELYRCEPHLGPGAVRALSVPDEFIVCPWTPPLACATQAVLAGTNLRLAERVTELSRLSGGWRVLTSRGQLTTRWLINAAGLFADDINRMAGHDGFTVTPRRGELIVFDKLSRPLINHTVLSVPTETTKGVMITPTVFGNVMLGPTAVDINDKTNTGTTGDGIAHLRGAGARILPALLEHDVTATYAGLRAATEHRDYQLFVDGERDYACAGGVRSTGLTSALAIAEQMRDELDRAGLPLARRAGGLPAIRMPNIGEASPRPYAQPDWIERDPEYGRVVCFCERVTRGEIRDALNSPLPPRDLDGLRRRTRVLMGRCQGFFCAAQVADMVQTAAPDSAVPEFLGAGR